MGVLITEAQAPINHDDIIVEEEENEVKGTEKSTGGLEETTGLLGEKETRGKLRKKGWLRCVW